MKTHLVSTGARTAPALVAKTRYRRSSRNFTAVAASLDHVPKDPEHMRVVCRGLLAFFAMYGVANVVDFKKRMRERKKWKEEEEERK